jgi:hypothetical protein
VSHGCAPPTVFDLLVLHRAWPDLQHMKILHCRGACDTVLAPGHNVFMTVTLHGSLENVRKRWNEHVK